MEYFKCSENSTEIALKLFDQFDNIRSDKSNDFTSEEKAVLFFVAYGLYWTISLYQYLNNIYKMLQSTAHGDEPSLDDYDLGVFSLFQISCNMCFPFYVNEHILTTLYWIPMHFTLVFVGLFKFMMDSLYIDRHVGIEDGVSHAPAPAA